MSHVDEAEEDPFEPDPMRSAGPPEPVGSPSGYVPLDFTTSRRDGSPARRSSSDWASSVWWLFVPVLLLLSFALWQRVDSRTRPAGYAEPDAPGASAGNGAVGGWNGRVELAGAQAAIGIRLEPLHPLAARQSFDASALAAKFRGGGALAVPGAQPWRLSFAVTTTRSGASSAVAIDDLSAVRVVGLEPLVPPSGAATGGEIVDPVATLMSFPTTPLRVGESCDLVFWGPTPGDEVAVIVPGFESAAILRRRERAVSSESAAIARLDARARATATTGRDQR